MTNREENDDCLDLRQQLDLLRSCLKLVQEKTSLLIRHDLDSLEASWAGELEMVERMGQWKQQPEAIKTRPSNAVSAEQIVLKAEISSVVREIQLANQTNSQLIQNGQQFCEVLYGAICPPQTYSPALTLVSRPVDAIFQAQY